MDARLFGEPAKDKQDPGSCKALARSGNKNRRIVSRVFEGAPIRQKRSACICSYDCVSGFPPFSAFDPDKPTRNLSSILRNRAIERLLKYDRYEGYLSAEELCQQSGLSPDNLKKLEEARLLVPDTRDGRYRPRLAGWGKKLAYLLGDGWEIEEIQRWSKERWKSGNPREFPSERK